MRRVVDVVAAVRAGESTMQSQRPKGGWMPYLDAASAMAVTMRNKDGNAPEFSIAQMVALGALFMVALAAFEDASRPGDTVGDHEMILDLSSSLCDDLSRLIHE